MYVYQLGTRQHGTSPITIPLVYETAHAHVGAVTSGTRSGRAGSLFLRRRPAPPRRSENAGNHSAQAMPSKHEGAHHLMVGISSPSLHEQSSRTENSNSHFRRDRKNGYDRFSIVFAHATISAANATGLSNPGK
jgi:hypothetical protein